MLASRSFRNNRSITQREDLLRMAETEINRERSLQLLNEWKEDCQGITAARTEKVHNIQKKEEIRMANKELIIVRRAALRCLLEHEYLQYQQELSRMGRAFFVQRL
ncbi:cilia- and flagella-associated protein 141 [Leptodactylus fuscus]|uniref:cilia- and flagella-associated protein 141 n=1 Tax=Leptodactylus fuscus TaxID=238119 RepID=UPI003F4ECCE6